MYEPVAKGGARRHDRLRHAKRQGVEGMTADQELDERLAYLAGEINVGIGAPRATASLFCLSKDIDEGLFVLKKGPPLARLRPAVIDRYRGDILSRWNSGTHRRPTIESREWQFLYVRQPPVHMSPYPRTEGVGRIEHTEDLAA